MKFRKAFSLIFAVGCVLFLSSCGGKQFFISISAKDQISGQTFSIDRMAQNGTTNGSSNCFSSKKSLEELKNYFLPKVRDDPNTTAKIYQNEYVLFIPSADGDTPFLLKCTSLAIGEEDAYYTLFAPIATFGDPKENLDGDLIYIPYHLLKNPDIQYYPYQSFIPNNTTYELAVDYDAVESFYRNLANCEVTAKNDILLVKETKNGVIIQLTFYEENGADMVRFSYPE